MAVSLPNSMLIHVLKLSALYKLAFRYFFAYISMVEFQIVSKPAASVSLRALLSCYKLSIELFSGTDSN